MFRFIKMCGRFFYSGDFRDRLDKLLSEEGIACADWSSVDRVSARWCNNGQSSADRVSVRRRDDASSPDGRAIDMQSGTAAGRDVLPSDASVVICEKGSGLSAVSMKWGFANPYRKGLIINARAETAMEKQLFSDSIQNRRCVIPASGFYEWDSAKARFRFTVPGDELVYLAGFFRAEQGAERYTVLTTAANESMKRVHDRMPVMIDRSEIGMWIRDRDRLAQFLERPQMQLAARQDSGQISMDLGAVTE